MRKNDWSESPTTSHSLEVEKRLTSIEVTQSERLQLNEARWREQDSRLSKLTDKLSWHERAILTIIGVLQILLQDKYPALVKLLKGLAP